MGRSLTATFAAVQVTFVLFATRRYAASVTIIPLLTPPPHHLLACRYESLRVSQVGVHVAGSYTRMSEQEMRTASLSFSDVGWAFFLCTAGMDCFAGMLEVRYRIASALHCLS